MGRHAAEIVVHGLVAITLVTLLLHLHPSRAPTMRFRFWLLALLGPVLLPPAYWYLCPARMQDAFRDDWALFSGSHWSAVSWHGLGAAAVWSLLAASLGAVLFLRDAGPLVLDAVCAQTRSREVRDMPGALRSAADRAAKALGVASPALRVYDTREPVLVCRGWRRPLIVASTGLVDRLAPDELAAAVAHEMSHVKRRDPALGWGLLVLRGVFFFSPGLQIAARALVHEMENRADDSAARVVGDPRVVVRSLVKLTFAPDGTFGNGRANPWQRLKDSAIQRRCALLLDERRMVPVSRRSLLATATGLALLLFFTVV